VRFPRRSALPKRGVAENHQGVRRDLLLRLLAASRLAQASPAPRALVSPQMQDAAGTARGVAQGHSPRRAAAQRGEAGGALVGQADARVPRRPGVG
jgi:hypothetical protein